MTKQTRERYEEKKKKKQYYTLIPSLGTVFIHFVSIYLNYFNYTLNMFNVHPFELTIH